MSHAEHAMILHVRPSHYQVGSDAAYLGAGVLTVLSYVLEAPLRFGLGALSLGPLIYARDGLAALCIAGVALSWLRGQRNASLMLGVGAILLAHTLIGFLTLPHAYQPLFGLKVFLPLLLGLSLAPLLVTRVRQVVKLAALCFALTAAGVIANVFVEFPWVGMSFDTAVGKLELSRQWWTEAGLRLPGFTRASYIAAQIMLVSLVPLLATRINWLARLTLIGLAGYVISLTTTKGAWTGLAVLSVCDALALTGLAPIVGAALLGLAFTCLALPVIGVQIGRASGEVPSWAHSFMERIGDMWPRAFALYDSPLSVVFGRGIGGIGMAQNFGEPLRMNAADNLMVFLLVTFGVAGPLYLGVLLARFAASAKQLPGSLHTRWAGGWLAVLLGVGLTTGLIEEPLTNISLGISLGLLCAAPRTARTFSPHRSEAPVRAHALGPARIRA